MSTAPTFRSPGSLPFASPEREEIIKRQWTFLETLLAQRLMLPSGQQMEDATGFVGISSGGRLGRAESISGSLVLIGSDFDITTDALVLIAGAAESLRIGTTSLSGFPAFVGNDAPAVASARLGKVDLTAQTADIATTALSNTPPAGLYAVEAYLVTTTNDVTAGTLALTVGYTDVGGARTATLIAAHPLTALSPSTGRQFLQLASGNITFATTVTGIFGASTYAVYLRVIALG